MSNRAETKTLIARQLATFNGLVWERIQQNQKLLDTYNTQAENLLATVERKMVSWAWQKFS